MLFGRRVTFALVVMASQVLLIALGITWLIQMLIIATEGSVQFVEENQVILTAEIVLAAGISLFAIFVLVLQVIKLRERRKGDERSHR